MKRKFFSVLLALVLVCSFSLVTATPAAAADRLVPDPYATIQEAINAADPGDTIIVAAGTYIESLTVDEEVSIIGVGPTTIIEPALDADGITITANNVVIKDLKVSTVNTAEDSNIAILIRGTDGVEVNTVTVLTTGDSAMGIVMMEIASSDLSILDCDITITNEGTAIYGAKIDGPAHSNWTITGNTLSAANEPGCNLELYDVDTVLVDVNTFLTTGSVNLVYSSEYSNVGSATISNNSFAGSGDIAGVTPTIWVESDFQGAAFGDNTAVDGVAITGNTFNNWYNAAIQIGEGVSGYDDVTNVVIDSNIFNMTTAYPAILDFTDLATGTGNTFNVSSPATIQDAIDSAFPGETINVAAGTYEEDLVILQALTLQGAGKTLVTVTGMLTIAASDVVVDGFKFLGTGTMDDKYEGTITINNLDGSITEVTISNNYITGGSSGIRVGLGPNDVSKVTIEYNEIVENPYKGALFYAAQTYAAHNVYDITIQGNVISDTGDTAISTYGLGPFTIVDNIIERNGGNGISLKYSVGDYVSGNTVTDNGAMGINMHEVTNCLVENNTVSGQLSEEVVTTFWGGTVTAGKGSGIYVHEASENNTIRYNDIIGNHNGILISREVGSEGSPSGNFINYNNIADNNYYGIRNALVDPPAPVDAEYNWWGDVAGPDTSPKTTGLHNPYELWTEGDAVSNDVDYLPWLIQIELVEDWNIWSAPIILDEACLAQLDAALTEETVALAYYFDSSTQDWWNIPEDASRLDAWYIKMKTPVTVNIWASSEATFPSQKEMKVGWNFVGLAELYEREASHALLDAYYGTGEAELFGYTKVMSPSLNGVSWTFLRPAMMKADSPDMLPCKGYWVLMVNDGVLGGFTETPIVEVENGE